MSKSQEKINKYVNSAINLSLFFRTLAVVVVAAIIAWTLFLSFFTKSNFFPKHPSHQELVLHSIRNYNYPHESVKIK